MTDNIGKHLIEISPYGTTWYRGVIEKETDKMYLARYPNHKEARRKSKATSDVLLPNDADVDSAMGAYNKTYRSFDGEIKKAEAALREIEQRRREDSIAAMIGLLP